MFCVQSVKVTTIKYQFEQKWDTVNNNNSGGKFSEY